MKFMHHDEELAMARQQVADLKTALVAARKAADVERAAAQLARDSAATAWRLSLKMRDKE
jgi:hypothetical protein